MSWSLTNLCLSIWKWTATATKEKKKKQKAHLQTEDYYLYHFYCESHYTKRNALENKMGKTYPY